MHLRQQRRLLGLRQRDLARAADVCVRRLSAWERGLQAVPADALSRLAAHLGVETAALAAGQRAFMAAAMPGEGYTTSRAGEGSLTPRRREPPPHRRRVLDLFCGAGGLSLGLEQAGAFVTTAGVDLLADRIATFTANHPCADGLAADLTALSHARLRALAGQVDVVVGGPPCQGFSSIRPFRTLTEGDPRNSLVEHFVLVIAGLQPRWFLFENVVGLLTHQDGHRLAALVAGLEEAGYRVDWRVLNAARHGVPQRRERVFVVGSRDGLPYRWPRPTHHFAGRSMAGDRPQVLRSVEEDGLPAALTLRQAIDDLPPVEAGQEAGAYEPALPARTAYQRSMREGASALSLHRGTRHSARMLEIIRHAGANISALPPGMVSSGFSSCYSRLEADRPSNTITVNFVHPASNRCIHPSQDRALTPREGARLQSFPDRYRFCGTQAQIVKQIGNAVPPLLAQALGQAILDSES